MIEMADKATLFMTIGFFYTQISLKGGKFYARKLTKQRKR